jgi:hypothetical protein
MIIETVLNRHQYKKMTIKAATDVKFLVMLKIQTALN